MKTIPFSESRFFRPISTAPNYVATVGGRIYRRPLWANNRWYGGGFVTPYLSNRTVAARLWVGAKRVAHSVGAWVLEAFVGPRPDGMECCHADGNPWNNALGNLRWGTSAENTADSIRHGTMHRLSHAQAVAAGKAAWVGLTPEQRSARVRKAWKTRGRA